MLRGSQRLVKDFLRGSYEEITPAEFSLYTVETAEAWARLPRWYITDPLIARAFYM